MGKKTQSGKVIIGGTGCALGDNLYNNINFNSQAFKKYLSNSPGDGRLKPGSLVFAEELAEYAKVPYFKILSEITDSKPPDAFNIGGPSIVSLIHSSQMLSDKDFKVKFFGIRGNDETGNKIGKILKKFRLNNDNYIKHQSLSTPVTDVLSDPEYNENYGERTFINMIGSAAAYDPQNLDPCFFDSDIVCFGGTALVPQIHKNLAGLLRKAKKNKCITIVNTVYDFQSEIKEPGKPWPLVNSVSDLSLIDVLIMDREEAIKISGKYTVREAAAYFSSTPVGSFFITNGSEDITIYSNDRLFKRYYVSAFPVSSTVKGQLRDKTKMDSDTTGCGDNFAGGIIVSIAEQLLDNPHKKMDIIKALAMGIASGGYACFYLGGVYHEKTRGEKRKAIDMIYRSYLQQLNVE